eukprot:Selendium_serpulae@DN10687_c0_g1_i1.p1
MGDKVIFFPPKPSTAPKTLDAPGKKGIFIGPVSPWEVRVLSDDNQQCYRVHPARLRRDGSVERQQPSSHQPGSVVLDVQLDGLQEANDARLEGGEDHGEVFVDVEVENERTTEGFKPNVTYSDPFNGELRHGRITKVMAKSAHVVRLE